MQPLTLPMFPDGSRQPVTTLWEKRHRSGPSIAAVSLHFFFLSDFASWKTCGIGHLTFVMSQRWPIPHKGLKQSWMRTPSVTRQPNTHLKRWKYFKMCIVSMNNWVLNYFGILSFHISKICFIGANLTQLDKMTQCRVSVINFDPCRKSSPSQGMSNLWHSAAACGLPTCGERPETSGAAVTSRRSSGGQHPLPVASWSLITKPSHLAWPSLVSQDDFTSPLLAPPSNF